MFYALAWFAVLSLLALWSLAAWAFHAIAAWTVSNAGALSGAAGASETQRVLGWLEPWMPAGFVPAMKDMVLAFTPLIESLLAWAPSLAGGLSVVVWVVWGLGTVLLIGLGLALSALVAVARRGARASGLAGRSSATAG